ALLLNPNDDDARHNLELTIKRLVIPSPTPISPTDQPTDEGENGATPTADSSSQTTPSVTNSADLFTAQPTTSAPSSIASELPPTVSVDDAKSILDAVQQAQQSLPNQQLSGTPASINSGKDW
ncbi:MAG: hypothetical protein H0X30_09470, partial [Anaerolineae bacterium]|nr:hypothetical protein [Anaerolineae bacterium]